MAIPMRRLLVGRPLPTSRAQHERLNRLLALPVFSSDALSSVAYGTEEILFALVLAGSAALAYSIWIGVAIAALLLVLTISYRQTIFAYPSGGGAYIVASDNLGMGFGAVAGAALLIDYVLTVAVSTASGVAAITSAVPALVHLRVVLCVGFILFVALANMRGVRESGALFSVPTYLFVGSFLAMIGVGLLRHLVGGAPMAYVPPAETAPVGGVHVALVVILLQAFASGCSALTGVEAISNGVQAFKAPEAHNAATTMIWMAVLLGTMFMGLTYLSHVLHILPSHSETVASQIARTVFGGKGAWYFLIQGATALILILAANTSFADFPRLSAILARDRLMPRWLAHLGDRLVFSNGITVLALLAMLLVVVFQGSVHRLIPLYAVGVFLSFTLSQAGMVRRWLRMGAGWLNAKTLTNLLGAMTTLVALGVIASMKFKHGAWVVVFLIIILVLFFFRIHHHYQSLRRQLTVEGWARPAEAKHTVIVMVAGVHRGIVHALDYARLIAADCRALYVEVDPQDTAQLYQRWEKWSAGVPLLILASPYRSLTAPVMQYLDAVQEGDPGHMVTVILPEFVPARWWHHLLHNQSAWLLKLKLLFRRNVIVTNLRYYLDE